MTVWSPERPWLQVRMKSPSHWLNASEIKIVLGCDINYGTPCIRTTMYWQEAQPCLPQHGWWHDICWTPSKPCVKTIEYQRHPNFPPVTAEKEGIWPDRQSRTGQKTTPGYSDAEKVIAISADKGYKTRRKPNQSPTVMNNIIFKSSVCPYILEGCIADLWNCYIG